MLEEVKAYNMQKKKLEKMLLEKAVAIKVMKLSVADLKRIVNHLVTKTSLLMKTGEELVSCSSQMTMSGGRVTHESLKHILPVYIGNVF